MNEKPYLFIIGNTATPAVNGLINFVDVSEALCKFRRKYVRQLMKQPSLYSALPRLAFIDIASQETYGNIGSKTRNHKVIL